MKTHCRQWVCGHCDCPVISLIFRLTTFDVRIRRQKSSKSANRVFYIPLNKGYFGKAIFSRLFSARYHILKKKKKKKTILGLCRCSVDNYSLIPGDLGGGPRVSGLAPLPHVRSQKKKKKKTRVLGLCRCSVDNYSLIPGDLPCQF